MNYSQGKVAETACRLASESRQLRQGAEGFPLVSATFGHSRLPKNSYCRFSGAKAMKAKVLVTGAGGFIASHLTEALLRSGYNVRVLVRYNSRASSGYLEELEPPQSWTRGVSQVCTTDLSRL